MLLLLLFSVLPCGLSVSLSVSVGPEGWRPKPRKSGAPRVGPRRVGPRRVGHRRVGGPQGGGPKILRFFPSPATISLFFVSLWGCSCGIVSAVQSRIPFKLCVWASLGHFVKPRRSRSRRGFTRQPESPNVHISGSQPSKTPPEFNERTPKRGRKE